MLGPDSRIPKEAEEEPNDRKMAATRFCRERDRKSSTSSFLKTRRGAAFCACAALFVIFTVIPAGRTQGLDTRDDCDSASCYPGVGNLLIGREKRLGATSTCGTRSQERYCVVSHLGERDRCFWCETKPETASNPSLNHHISNIVYKMAPNGRLSWWQSENGKENVSIRVDFEAQFHMTHIIIDFKTVRPAAMIVERSWDFGKTWHAYGYYAHNCASEFPGIPERLPRSLTDVVCDGRYSSATPLSGGQMVVRILPGDVEIKDPYSEDVLNLVKITNLRINFTRLHTLGDDLLDTRSQIKEKYYYALHHMTVRGSCFCYGHASKCVPVEGMPVRTGMVHGRCECTHHTAGLNCERCEDFFNDVPWRPGIGKKINTCKRCKCNNHATACQFNQTEYDLTGSGGVCINCAHNTEGKHCDTCKRYFYHDPQRDIADMHACLPCDCDPRGSRDDGVCDPKSDPANGMIAGMCHCKRNVDGRRCDRCKMGFWNFEESNPDGCQACTCDPIGIIENQGCNQYSGECQCKANVRGRDCNQCAPEHYGLSANDPLGCKACRCSPGGSYDNDCDVVTGQCRCRPHVTGRQCDRPETGYFAGLMDYMLYEAEFAKHSDNCEVVKRERYSDSKETTWTGLGFMRVYEGSYLEFDVPDVRATNEYDLVIRYEPQRAGAWEDVDVKILRSSPIDPNGECRHAYGQSDEYRGVQMPDNARSVLIHPPVCLEAGKNYTIRVSFRSFSRNEPTPTATILVDAIALLPKPESLPFFKGPEGDYLRQEFEQYRCQNAFLTVTKPSLNDVCQKHLYSIGFYTLGQAKGCDCDPTGSLSSRCDPLGGQCECKPNVVGRRCDSCAPGTYGFGPNGCTPCDCNAIGSLDNFCDVRTGECKCRDFKYGRQCDVCQPGRWNFPVCEPCNCNGHADVCDSTTGHCLSCADSTAGPHCETCLEGYYGDPVLGRNIPCRPCPCPETKATGHSFADRCFLSPTTNDVVCDCQFGYTGPRCDRCGDNYFGTPDVRGRECRPCNCSGNTDLTQPGNCDPISGECMRCLYNTEGFNCHECKPGYYGDALRQECIPCNCFFLGTVGQSTVCDRVTGQCPCLPNVIGLDCAKCAPNHWRIASGDGCSACDCDPAGAFSTQCNEFDGQCECRPGFGGRQCDQCLADHWGDPTEDECFPCDCNPIGRNSTQCDKINGKCFCRPGIGGDKCDRCARGFVGSFPNCEPCIECFDNWDTIITDLRAQTEEIVKAAADIKQSGSTGAYPQQFEEMEEKLHKITSLLQNNTLSNEDLEMLKVKVEQLKSNLTEISQERNKVDRDIFNTTQRVYLAGIELDRLKDDAEELKAKANALEANATQLQEANVEGALEITKNAERRSNAALEKVRSTDETLKNSARQRKRTEQRLERSSDTMTNKQGDNDQTIERIDRRLTDIEKEIPDINDQVCDKRGDPCDGLCGGGGCNHCGGLSCKEGSVETSKSALRLAEEAGELLSSRRSANEEQWRKVSQSKVKADEAKSAAEAALQASTNAYNRSAEANEDMKSLMERINEFLNAKGATPAEIRTLAEEVLQKSISLQPQQIQKLAAEINATIQSLTNIDDIIDATAGDLERANSLKERADRAKEQADKVLLVVEAVLEALNAAESAQERAKAAREDADSKVSQAAGLLAQTKTEMSRTQEEANGQTVKVKELKDRLKNVTKDIVDIESDMNSAEREANEANQMANNAAREASMLEKKYGEVKDEFESANKDSQLVRDRARKLQELVMRLDKNITEEVAEVMKMQEEYSRYEERLGQMGDKLRRLEEEMDGYLRVITTKNDHYRNC